MLKHIGMVSLVLAGALAARAAHADPPTAPHGGYRFEITVAGLDDAAGHPAPTTLVLDLEAGHTGVVNNTRAVPLQVAGATANAAAAPRQLVGVRVQLVYSLRGDVAVTRGAVELSSPQPATAGAPLTIVRLTLNSSAALTPGAPPTMLGSVYDVHAHRTYTVTLAAHRVP